MNKTQSMPSSEASILNDEMTREATVARLQEHLPLEAEGYKADNEVIFEVITHAAVTGRSIEASCQELEVAVIGNTVREKLNSHLPGDKLNELEAGVNHTLQNGLPRKARRAAAEVAVDLREQPFYGQDDELT